MSPKITKSQRRIQDSFFALRRRLPVEKITVTALCQLADVNKSTFYVYWHDIYHLADTMENDVIEKIMARIREPERLVSLTDDVIKDVFRAFGEYRDVTDVLFSDSREWIFPDKIAKAFMSVIQTHVPEAVRTDAQKVALTYRIYGAFYAYQTYADTPDIIDILNHIMTS